MTIRESFSALAAIHPQYDDLGMLGPLLWGYANLCDHITEFGVDDGTSTWSWLHSDFYRKKIIRSYDIYPDCLISEHLELAEKEGIDWTFTAQDTLQEGFEIEETDLLFIDTDHQYGQLLGELRQHGGQARKYIMMHDTYTYGAKSANGFHKGLRDSIKEWLEEVNEEKEVWTTDMVFDHSNGLTILRRL